MFPKGLGALAIYREIEPVNRLSEVNEIKAGISHKIGLVGRRDFIQSE